jgi:nucleotide-binding universal stress UspA family protein
MFTQIVVGVDGDGGGRDAVALATKLATAETELTFAHVYAGDFFMYRGVSAAFEASERERTLQMLRKAQVQAGVEAELRWRIAGSVGRGLHEVCELVGADLLVVGSSRRGLLGRVLIGDDMRAALNGAPCALAIAPADYSREPGTMREIGVAYNGSPESDHAVAVGRELAKRYGAKLSAFEAVSLPTYAFLGGPTPIDDAPQTLIDDALMRVAALGEIEPHAAYGQPVEELALYSASLDLLVVGSRGYGPLGRLIHGSISRELARRARCPLLVLTRSARTTEIVEASGQAAVGAGR